MKNLLKLFLCFAVLTSATSAANAQGLGGLINKGKDSLKKGEKVLKKGKETVDKILGADESTSNEASTPVSQTVNSSGITISNPVSSFIEINPVGLYGVSTSENYGDVYLVLNVKNLIPKDVTRFGNRVQNQNMIAVDNNGKVYNVDSSGHFGYDTPEGLMVKIVLDEPGLMFQGVKKDIDMMQQVKFGVFSDAYHQGNVILNNVPIFWDQIPE